MLLIIIIVGCMTGLTLAIAWECLSEGEGKWSLVSLVASLVLGTLTLGLISVDKERTNLKEYRVNQRQIEVVEERQGKVKNELDELVNKLPENTLDLYKTIGNKKDSINLYPDIEFVRLIEEQMKSQQDLQKKLTALYQEQAFIQAQMENRRMFFPGRLVYKDDVVEKLKGVK